MTHNIDLTTLTLSQGFSINGDAAGDRSGWSVNGAGDVNGGGYADVIIGANLHPQIAGLILAHRV